MSKLDPRDEVRERMADEIGTIVKDAPESICMLYPSPYRVGMSSLGMQTLYRTINNMPSRAAHRAFLPDDVDAFRESRIPLFTYEGQRPVADYPIVGLSVAYELEIAGLVQALELAGIPPLREDRDEGHPFILAGGPLTFSNPLPPGPYVDAELMGEADETMPRAIDSLFGVRSLDAARAAIARRLEVTFRLHREQYHPPAQRTSS